MIFFLAVAATIAIAHCALSPWPAPRRPHHHGVCLAAAPDRGDRARRKNRPGDAIFTEISASGAYEAAALRPSLAKAAIE
jgi:hypothetical protein